MAEKIERIAIERDGVRYVPRTPYDGDDYENSLDFAVESGDLDDESVEILIRAGDLVPEGEEEE